ADGAVPLGGRSVAADIDAAALALAEQERPLLALAVAREDADGDFAVRTAFLGALSAQRFAILCGRCRVDKRLRRRRRRLAPGERKGGDERGEVEPAHQTMSRCSMPLVMSLPFASLPCSLMLSRTSLVESAKRSASS